MTIHPAAWSRVILARDLCSHVSQTPTDPGAADLPRMPSMSDGCPTPRATYQLDATRLQPGESFARSGAETDRFGPCSLDLGSILRPASRAKSTTGGIALLTGQPQHVGHGR